MSGIVIEFIKNEFESKRKKNPSYSLRAFAKSLSLDHSTLSKMLSGKRVITFEMADKILSNLNIQKSTKNSLLLTFSSEENFVTSLKDEEFFTLQECELEASYQWYFYAILSSLEISFVSPTILGVSKFLGLDLEIVQKSVLTLIKMKAIKYKDDKLFLTGNVLSTNKKNASNASKKAHLNCLQQSIRYLKHGDLSRSDYSGTTVAIPTEKIQETRRRIKEFRRDLGAWLAQDTHEKDDVYRLGIQFFPIKESGISKDD